MDTYTDDGAHRSEWSLELIEPALMDHHISYTVSDAPPSVTEFSTRGWIEFSLPTRFYRNARGEGEALVRLTVEDGQLAMTAPELYPRGSIRRSAKTPSDQHGNLRVVRLGDDDCLQLDLMIMTDSEVVAVMRLETVRRPLKRGSIVDIACDFIEGIDLLDCVVETEGLKLGHG